MKIAALALLQLFLVAPAFGSQVLTADDLRRAGVVRIADVLALAEGWSFDTIEGFTLNGRPPGFPFGERPAFLVMIDDVPMDLDQLGVTSLNRLPLSVDDIHTVTYQSGPAFGRGRFRAGGVIHFRTRRPYEPIEIHARHATGSETGDPGPYQFTQFNSKNIERFGFESSVSAGGSFGSVWTEGAYRRARHYASDEAILDRYVAIGGGDFRVLEKEAPSVRIGVSPPGSSLQATGFARFSEIDEGFFLRPVGQEIPVENQFQQAGAEVSMSAKGWNPSGVLMVTANELDGREGSAAELDWRTRSIEGDLAATRRGATIGVRAGFHDVRAGDSSPEDSWTSGGLFGGWSHRHEERDRSQFGTNVDFGMEHSRDDTGIAMTASHWRRFRPETFAEVRLAAGRLLPEESVPFWYWGEKQLAPFQEEAGIAPASGIVEATKLGSADATITTEIGPFASLKAGAFFRTFRDVAVVKSDSVPAIDDGNVAGGTLSFTAASIHGMRPRGWIRFQDSAGGTSAFREAARAAPRILGRAAVSTTPFRNFDVDVALRAQSSTTVAAWSSLDLSIQKYFTQRRLRAGLAFQNLLNNPYRTHAIGQITGLTVAVQLEWSTSGQE